MGKRHDLFGHDKRDDEQIRKDNEAYFDRNKNKTGGFQGLTGSEKEAIKKGLNVVKKSVKKAGKKVVEATTTAGKKLAEATTNPSKKISKVKDYGAHVAGTVIGKTERAVKRGAKKAVTGAKIAKFIGKLGWKSLKAYDRKTQARKKKPKFNIDTKEWE